MKILDARSQLVKNSIFFMKIIYDGDATTSLPHIISSSHRQIYVITLLCSLTLLIFLDMVVSVWNLGHESDTFSWIIKFSSILCIVIRQVRP